MQPTTPEGLLHAAAIFGIEFWRQQALTMAASVGTLASHVTGDTQAAEDGQRNTAIAQGRLAAVIRAGAIFCDATDIDDAGLWDAVGCEPPPPNTYGQPDAAFQAELLGNMLEAATGASGKATGP